MNIAGGSEKLRGVEERNAAMRQETLAFPASFAQQRFWFLDRLEPGNSTYNTAQAFRLTGQLQRTALERSLNEIVRRHEILRTTFVDIDGEARQVIGSPRGQPLSVISLTRIPADRRDAEARRLIDQESWRPFDLTEGPLVRATLFEIDAEEHILLLGLHHIVSDGWSNAVFLRELGALYEAFAQGKVPSLPELPIQYTDYAVWQRERLQGEFLEGKLSYWKKKLEGIPVLELPTDRPRPAIQSHRGARRSFTLPTAITDGLNALSRREGATLFMTLLAAFQVLLHRYSGQDDIAVGLPIAGRTRAEMEGLIGPFLNTLVLRGDLSGDPKFNELLARVRQTALEAYQHQDLPFEKLVEELNPRRDPSRSPLFQAMLTFYNVPRAALSLTGLEVSPVEVESETSKFELTLTMAEAGGSLQGTFEYSTDLFDEATIERMIGHLRTLLEGIAAHPEKRLSKLPLLTEAERRQILVEWDDTKRDYPKDQCLHQLFEEQVERTPDAVAVRFEDRRLTYRELNARANQLAHYLRKSGVEPETRVGIYIERSLEMTIAILGVLKAGGAYVPLDSAYPKERLAFMLAETQPVLLLTKRPLPDDFPEFHGQTLCLDRDGSMVAGEKAQNPEKIVSPDNLAYVTYTSGSTGRPKGVLIHHRGVANYFFYLHETYNFSGADTVLQLAPLSFDASVRDLIAPLTSGARVVIVGDFDSKEPAALVSAMTKHRVTCLPSIVPTMLNAVVDAATGRARLDSMRLILVSGEALSGRSCRRAQEVFGPGVSIVNQYGPTESTMTCSYHRVVAADYDRGVVPLGKPIRNMRMHILDSDLQIVPVGIPGELHIGGAGLARGYLNRPELTAKKFIPDPFSDEPGARLYKTGDLARYLPDGTIEFLGRIDDQVKIRGFRVEPGEIEAVLAEHPGVRESVVVAREDEPHDPSTALPAVNSGPELVEGRTGKHLVAYVVPKPESPPTAGELRGFLKETLPDYMVPSRFVLLAALPLTPNGKVDRRNLPAPERTRSEGEISYVAPRSETEQVLATIWSEVLKLDQVGVDDNFFELGGHSLRATQVISRMRDALEVELSLRSFFETPTVGGLAHVIDRAKDGGARSSPPKIAPVSRQPRRPRWSL